MMLGELARVKVSDKESNTESSEEKCDGTVHTKNSHEHPLLHGTPAVTF